MTPEVEPILVLDSVVARPLALPAPRSARVEILEPLRGFAALAVAWFHFTVGSGFAPEGWLRASGKFGWLGVEIFFVISGFIIPFSLHQSGYRFPRHSARFVLKRIVRLDPPYLATILLTLALTFASAAAPGFRGAAPKVEWLPLVLHLGYLNAFFGFPWVVPVLWTLAIEFQFYLLMALAFPLVASRSRGLQVTMLAVFCSAPFFISNEALVFRYLSLFLFGILTFQRSIGRLSTSGFLWGLSFAACASVMTLGPEIAVAGLGTALLIAFVKLPRSGPLVFLGGISYSLYLLHVPIGGRVVNLGARWSSGAVSCLAVSATALLVSIGAAWLMNHFIERPARQWSSAIRYD